MGVAESADLGIVRGTLRDWLDAYGTGRKTAADGTQTSSPLRSTTTRSSGVPAAPTVPADETPEQKITRLEAENAALRVETTKLATEREILQKAAK